jgi:CRISPR/Cas system-associated protein endoribonuclease Cas2
MRRFVKLFGSYRIVVSIIGQSDNAEEQKAIQKFVEQLISQGFVEEPGAIDEGEAE